MKGKFFVLLGFTIFTCSARAQINYKVEGNIGRSDSVAKVYLQYTQEGNAHIDSTASISGHFAFSGSIKEPLRAYLVVAYLHKENSKVAKKYTQLYLEEGKIFVNSSDSLKTATVKGGVVNENNNLLKELLRTNTEENDKLYKEYYSLSKEERKDKSAYYDSLFDKNEANKKSVLKTFLQEHNSTVVSLNALKEYAGYAPDYDTAYPAFTKLNALVRNSESGIAYAKFLENIKNVSVGKIAPDFTQTDTSGKNLSLSSLKGKYVLVDFWASWCGPCRAENPNVVKAYQKYKDKNFTVLGVSLDQKRENWIEAISKDHLDWNHVSDLKYWSNAAAKLYAVQAIPQNFLLDPEGKIIKKDLRGNDLDNTLSNILK